MEKIQEKDDVISTTIRVYRKDMEKFRNYVSNTAGITQKECFGELVQILDKTRGENQQGDLMTFWTSVRNEFNPERSKESRVFSITGKRLTWISANNQIICDENNRYTLVNQQTYKKIDIDCKLNRWNNAINMQFDVNLDIEKWIREHLNVDYNFQINVYKDVVRDKFLIYDYMELTKSNWENIERKQLVAHRFFYINNKEEIEKRLQEDFYVLIGENEKKIISESLEIKTILPNNLEDELKKYYEI